MVPLALEMAALTHKGRVRDGNEDSLYFDVNDRTLIVCDGMGGHAGGHIASEMGVQVVSNALRMLRGRDWFDEDHVIDAMKNAIFAANDHILSRAHVDPTLMDMGTTISAMAFMHDRVVMGHVGDSRIYRLTDLGIEQISDDHSLVGEKIRAGELEPDSEEAQMLSNILTRALGMDQVRVDIMIEDLRPGDIYLSCSDGLTDMIGDDDIYELTMGAPDLQSAALRLIEQANANGGFDNITVGIAPDIAGQSSLDLDKKPAATTAAESAMRTPSAALSRRLAEACEHLSYENG